MQDNRRKYCTYCKGEMYQGNAYTKDGNGHIYHPLCFIQMNTYTDDFGNEFEEKDYE